MHETCLFLYHVSTSQFATLLTYKSHQYFNGKELKKLQTLQTKLKQTKQATMATISNAKTTFFNLAKPQHHPSLSLPHSARKASRVYFTSASKHNEDRNHAEEGRRKASETIERTKERAQETKEKAKERAEEAKEKSKGAAETAREGKDRATEKAHEAKEKAKQGTTAQSFGEKAKQSVQEAWGIAKETTQKIKETVVGKDEYEGREDEPVEDHRTKRTPGGSEKKD